MPSFTPWQNSGIRFGGFPGNQLAPAASEDWSTMLQQQNFANQQREGQNAWQAGQNAAGRDLAWNSQQSQQGFQGAQADRQRQFEGAQAQAQRDLQTALQNSQQGFQGGQNALDRQQQMSMLTTQQGFQGGQNEAQRALELRLGSMPWDFKNKVFSTFAPTLQSMLANPTAMQTNVVGGQNTPQPAITAGPVWSDAQVNAQVNSQKAANAAAVASQQRALQAQVAGQGFGANSPLLAALGSGLQGQRMAADQAADTSTRWNAAQGNAQQLLAGQQAQENQWQDWQTADIARRQAQTNYTTQLLAALAGMIG